MSAIERNFGDIARSLAVETALVEHPDLQNPASPPEELHSEEESVAETLLGAAAEIGIPRSKILSIFERVYGFLTETGIVSPVNNGEKPFHIPSELTSFFNLSPAQATHLASPDAAPVTAEQTKPETQRVLEALLKGLEYKNEMVRYFLDCSNPLLAEYASASWRKTLKTIHGFSPATAVQQAQSVLDNKNTPPYLREAASDFVDSNFQSVKTALLPKGSTHATSATRLQL